MKPQSKSIIHSMETSKRSQDGSTQDQKRRPSLENQAYHEIQRLRRFLSFCLAVDYELTFLTPNQITSNDFIYYVRLSWYCFLSPSEEQEPFIKVRDLKWLEPRDIYIDDARISKQLLEPARALGVPFSVVILMLRAFLAAIPFWTTRWDSTIDWLVERMDLKSLAAKFCLDRDVLLNALALPHVTDHQKLLEERMRAEHAKWFDRLCGPADFEVGNARNGVVETLMEESCQRNPRLAAVRSRDTAGSLRKDCEYAANVMKCLRLPAREESWDIGILRRWLRFRGAALFSGSI